MGTKENRYGITADQMQPGRIFWHESGGTGVIVTVNGIAYTTFVLGGGANQATMEGGDVQFIQEITPFDVTHAMRALSRFNPGSIRHRWAKLRRRADLPYGYRLDVANEAGTAWPVTFHCNCMDYGGDVHPVPETSPPWRGVRTAARAVLADCAKATSFEDDWQKEETRRMDAEAKLRELQDENARLKAQRKARKR